MSAALSPSAAVCVLSQTAFNFFAAEQWASLRGELGANAAPQDISRLIGERWNKATEEERAPYVVQVGFCNCWSIQQWLWARQLQGIVMLGIAVCPRPASAVPMLSTGGGGAYSS